MWLALHEAEVLEFLKQAERGAEGAAALTLDLFDPPQPGYVDVGVAHCQDFAENAAAQGRQTSLQFFLGSAQACVPHFAARSTRIQFAQRGPDHLLELDSCFAVLREELDHVFQVAKRAEEALGHAVDQTQLGLAEKGFVRPRTAVRFDGYYNALAFRQRDVAVVQVSAVVGLPVQEDEPFAHVEVEEESFIHGWPWKLQPGEEAVGDARTAPQERHVPGGQLGEVGRPDVRWFQFAFVNMPGGQWRDLSRQRSLEFVDQARQFVQIHRR